MFNKEIWPLTSVFHCNESKILDHMVTMREFDYSISEISSISKVNAKTTLSIVGKLEKQDIIKKTRTVRKTVMYRLNLRSPLAKLINKLAFEIAKKRNNEILAKH